MKLTSLLLLCTVVFIPSIQAQDESGPVAVPVRKKESEKKDKSASSSATSPVVNVQAFDPVLMGDLVLRYTNAERQKAGIVPCGKSPELAQSATIHSTDMANRGYFSHKGGRFLSRTTVSDRVSATGLTHAGLAENIAMLPVYDRVVMRTDVSPQGVRTQREESERLTYDAMARSVVEQWMTSPGHQRNIMDPSLNALGVGCAIGQSQGFPYVYFTQNFARVSRQ